jgi:hypothetical protein
LAERGRAKVWEVLEYGRPARAFALRFDGVVRAYLNRCAHVPAEMDWQPGEFLDATAAGSSAASTAPPTSRRTAAAWAAPAAAAASSPWPWTNPAVRCIGILPATSSPWPLTPRLQKAPDEHPRYPAGPGDASPGTRALDRDRRRRIGRCGEKPARPRAAPGLESALERGGHRLLRQQRTERRWRVFFRLAWLGLVAVVLWAC